MTGVQGVDYSFARPDPAGLVAAGRRFAVRYVGTASHKNLGLVEAGQLRRAGLDLVATYEASTQGFMASGADGAEAMRQATMDATAAGMPPDRPIYFALDVDPASLSLVEWEKVQRFLNQAGMVRGTNQNMVGVYGGYAAIERLVPGWAAYGWQTYAWSHGGLSSKACLYQYRNGVTLAGGTVDLDVALADDFGQWSYHRTEPPPVVRKEERMFMVSNKAGSVLLVIGGVSYLVVSTADVRALAVRVGTPIPVSEDQFNRFKATRVA